MKIQHIAYPKIRQFSGFLKSIKMDIDYVGKDENGESRYIESEKYPIVKVKGTVKLHGDNAGIGVSSEGDVWCQSRRNIITPTKDNKGFAMWIKDKKDVFKELANKFCEGEDWKIIFYGEWAGGNNQGGSSLSGLERRFFIFGGKIIMDDKELWISSEELHYGIKDRDLEKYGIYSIECFSCFELNIDLDNPERAQTQLEWITLAIENECPVAKVFGKKGVGEGVVWKCTYTHNKLSELPEYTKTYLFKTKGHKHSGTKIKKIANVDIETINSINQFVGMVVTENRVKQAMDESLKTLIHDTENKNYILERKDTPHILRWISKDILVEDMELLLESKLEWKQVSKQVSKLARQYYFKLLDEHIIKSK